MIYTLSPSEANAVFQLAEKLTGSCQKGAYKRDVILQNVARRIAASKQKSLASYLVYIEKNDDEYHQLISALTIHTTSWFREQEHFEKIWNVLSKARDYSPTNPLTIFSAACSTGKEVYSFALMLEQIRTMNPIFDYKILGMDIDPVSIDMANKAIYPSDDVSSIPQKYKQFLKIGSGKSAGYFTFTKDIRQRCKFVTGDLRTVRSSLQHGEMSQNIKKWDLIICRNVLIYFQPKDVAKIVHVFVDHLEQNGVMCLGHSEAIDPNPFKLKALGNAMYQRKITGPTKDQQLRRVLVVDDSAVIRRVISQLFIKAQFEVIQAASAAEATECLKSTQVDIITLDLNMPEKDGATWLLEERKKGLRTPVVVVSDTAPTEAQAIVGALENGAQDYIEKKDLHDNPDEVLAQITAIVDHQKKLKMAPTVSATERVKGTLDAKHPDLIVIGASTGGTEALTALLKMFPHNTPPIVVVQHITSNFLKAFASRLAGTAKLSLGSDRSGEILAPGTIYLAQGDHHIGVKQRGDKKLEIIVSEQPPIGRHRPSVDFLFSTVADIQDITSVGVILTGMGKDGADGLLKMRKTGSLTLAQNEQSCVVFGMPREAIQRGAAQYVGNLNEIRRELEVLINVPPQRKYK